MEDRKEVTEKAIKDITEALFSGKAILEGDLRLILVKSIDDVWNAGRRHGMSCGEGHCPDYPRRAFISRDNDRPETVVDVGVLGRQIEAYNADRLLGRTELLANMSRHFELSVEEMLEIMERYEKPKSPAYVVLALKGSKEDDDIDDVEKQIKSATRIIYQVPGESTEELAKKIREYGDVRGF